MLALYFFGVFYEHVSSVKASFLTFFISGLAANILSSAISPKVYSAGASASILGVFGGVFRYKRVHGMEWKLDLAVAVFLVLGGGLPGINVPAHFFGFLTGYFVSTFLNI